MRDNNELMNLVERFLLASCDSLWDELTPEERQQVFPSLIKEYVEANY